MTSPSKTPLSRGVGCAVHLISCYMYVYVFVVSCAAILSVAAEWWRDKLPFGAICHGLYPPPPQGHAEQGNATMETVLTCHFRRCAACCQMHENKYLHLPVVDENDGTVVGVVGVMEIIQATAGDRGSER